MRLLRQARQKARPDPLKVTQKRCSFLSMGSQAIAKKAGKKGERHL